MKSYQKKAKTMDELSNKIIRRTLLELKTILEERKGKETLKELTHIFNQAQCDPENTLKALEKRNEQKHLENNDFCLPIDIKNDKPPKPRMSRYEKTLQEELIRVRITERSAAHALDNIRQDLGLSLIQFEHPARTRDRIITEYRK